MNDLKENRYLLKANSYIIDLFNVDFITWKENENEEGTYWTKLHVGTKECRYICKTLDELNQLIAQWSRLRGDKLNINATELIEW